jgi:osmotically inducible protein OsmC
VADVACFNMSFVRQLGKANFVLEHVDSKSEISIEKDGDGLSITPGETYDFQKRSPCRAQ